MSGKGGKEAVYQGTNRSGNDYTSYQDGGYRYTNTDSQGATKSTYYNTGSGHGFYQHRGDSSKSFHENYNQGYRTYPSQSSRRQVDYQTINSDGNAYTRYSDGSYRYTNYNDQGRPTSSYYYTGKGHAFYNDKRDSTRSFHENQNKGYRTYFNDK